MSKKLLFASVALGLVTLMLPVVTASLGGSSESVSPLGLITMEERGSGGGSGILSPDRRSAFVASWYIGTLLLAVFAVVGRKSLSRKLGIATLVVGLLSTAYITLVFMGLNKQSSEVAGLSIGFGFYLLMLASLLGASAGLLATAKPDPVDEPQSA